MNVQHSPLATIARLWDVLWYLALVALAGAFGFCVGVWVR